MEKNLPSPNRWLDGTRTPSKTFGQEENLLPGRETHPGSSSPCSSHYIDHVTPSPAVSHNKLTSYLNSTVSLIIL